MPTHTDPVKTAITEARRAQILDAAVKVFAEKGFDKATVKDVA
ncbi:MAG TPA: helix-turn-helix transcriptional regulator, partial [Chloroflexi bacterium]|nr:helix-turn-helix transcriptional regulator [Chloroflexota bacterium]